MKIFLFFLTISQINTSLIKQARNLEQPQNPAQTKTVNPSKNFAAPPTSNQYPDEYEGTSVATHCNQEMMTSYGLSGLAKPLTRNHKYCPNISHNCCTVEDETLSMQLWTSQNRYLIEKYYETYLYSMKYILGYSVQGMILAEDFKDSENEKCKNAAVDYLDMNMNPKVTEDIYHSYAQSLERMGVIRKGFYCILCDAKTQDRLTDYWSSTNLFYNDRIYFSKGFCRELVESTIRSSYYTVFYVKRYAEDLATLINCRMNSEKEELVYEIPYWTKQQVKNCYYFKNKYFFFFCERYCEKFHLVKANEIFDGDLPELKKFVDLIMKNKDEVFHSPNSNILMTWVTYEEDILKYNFEDVFKNNIFFKASTKRVKLDEFETDVLYFGGMNPWESCENSLYDLVIAGWDIMNFKVIFVILGLLFS